MNCTEFSNLLDAWLDGALAPEEAQRMEAHAAACPECGALAALRRDCRALDGEIEVPAAFSASWRQAVRAEAEKAQRAERKRSFRGWLTAAAALVFVVGGAAVTRNSSLLKRHIPAAGNGAAVEEEAAPEPLAEPLALTAKRAEEEPRPQFSSMPTAPTAMATSLPLIESAGETADFGAAAKQPLGAMSAAASSASNVVYGDSFDLDAEEDMEALYEEPSWDDDAPLLAAMIEPEEAAQEAVQTAEDAAEETIPSADAEEAAEEREEAPSGSLLREIGLWALCALPWAAAAAIGWFAARRISQKKDERKN